MSSSNRRERELARAKRERQLSRATEQRNRYTWVMAFAAASVVVVGLVIFWPRSGGPGDAYPNGTADLSTITSSASTDGANLPGCTNAPAIPTTAKSWDKIPVWDATEKYASGNPTFTLTTNCGDVVIEMFGSKAPETVQTFSFLSNQKYFDDTRCHRLTTDGLYVLQCGDPTGTGTGGPGFTIKDENFPEAGAANYPEGIVAMANTGAKNSGGSQFFIVYGDTQLAPTYTIFGKVVEGLDIIQKIAANGVVDGAADGAPAQPISILRTDFQVARGKSTSSPSASASK